MKKFMKFLVVAIILVVAIVGGYIGYQYISDDDQDTITSSEIVQERLETVAELNTGSYLCTSVMTQKDSKEIKGWKVPLTEKSYIVSYDASVTAGIKDLTKAQVKQNGNTVVVTLPAVEITGIEIDNDSFEVFDESTNIFNPISLEDLNNTQKALKEKIQEQAVEKGVLDLARENAEEILIGMLSSANGEYEVQIEWEQSLD